jgi:mRNA interferase RelE/StbE
LAEFDVRLTEPAVRDIQSLPENARAGIIDGFIALRQYPFPAPPLIKKLKGFGHPLYRMRTGDYRILYRIDKTIITVMRVIDRKDLDRTIKRLKGHG